MPGGRRCYTIINIVMKQLISTAIVSAFVLSSTILVFTRGSHIFSEEVEVIMTDKEYVPSFLVVPLRTKITWVNTGDNPKWPASNFHPTHDLYPEKGGCIGSKLDSCGPLERGEKFSFIFNRSGNWGIHDHLFPGITMVIKIVDKKDLDSNSERSDETSLPSDSESFLGLNFSDQTKIITELARVDPRQSWEFLKKAFMVNGVVVGNAHEFAHMIGNNIYTNLGLKGIAICDETFAYGCYHGVTEEMLKEEGVDSILSIQNNCLEFFPPAQSYNYTGCIHGIGHGLVTLYGLDVQKALKDCDLLKAPYRPFCYDGVFMERAFIVSSADLNSQNPWELCESLEQGYQYNCARYQALLFRQTLGLDFVRAAEECFGAKSKILQEACMATLGHMVAQSVTGNTEEIKQICGKISGQEGISLCMMNAAIEIVFQKYNGWEDSPKILCSTLDLPWEERCLHSLQGPIR